MERREKSSWTNHFSSDKVSENVSNDHDLLDKLSNGYDILDILSNDYDILDKLSNDYDILYKLCFLLTKNIKMRIFLKITTCSLYRTILVGKNTVMDD